MENGHLSLQDLVEIQSGREMTREEILHYARCQSCKRGIEIVKNPERAIYRSRQRRLANGG